MQALSTDVALGGGLDSSSTHDFEGARGVITKSIGSSPSKTESVSGTGVEDFCLETSFMNFINKNRGLYNGICYVILTSTKNSVNYRHPTSVVSQVKQQG